MKTFWVIQMCVCGKPSDYIRVVDGQVTFVMAVWNAKRFDSEREAEIYLQMLIRRQDEDIKGGYFHISKIINAE